MSKITQAKREAKAAGKELKGKQKKIAESNAKKEAAKEKQPKQKSAISGLKNLGCCCTCKHFPQKLKGETQPCKILKNYTARKAQHPECYKCKFEM